jgi:hypothetical protein
MEPGNLEKRCGNLLSPLKAGNRILLLSFAFVLLVIGCSCSKDSRTSPPPGTHRVVYRWVEGIFYVQGNDYREFPFDAVINDTVYGEVLLLNGEEIAMCGILDETNFHKWENNQACQFIQYGDNKQYYEFYFCMPLSNRCYLVIFNAGSQNYIEVRTSVHVARWEK